MRSGGVTLARARWSETVVRQVDGRVEYEEGDRIFLPCQGGPSQSRLEMYPPRLEIEEHDGMYVLVDDGPVEQWYYLFVTTPLD